MYHLELVIVGKNPTNNLPLTMAWRGQDQLSAAMTVYVEEALGLHVGELVRFVHAAEAAAKQQDVPEGLPVPGYGPPEAAPIMKDFASRWTSAIEALNKCAALSCPGGPQQPRSWSCRHARISSCAVVRIAEHPACVVRCPLASTRVSQWPLSQLHENNDIC